MRFLSAGPLLRIAADDQHRDPSEQIAKVAEAYGVDVAIEATHLTSSNAANADPPPLPRPLQSGRGATGSAEPPACSSTESRPVGRRRVFPSWLAPPMLR